MADSIRFKEFMCCDTETNKTIEEDVKALFAYAGLHDRSFDDELIDAFASLSATVWDTANAQGTWVIDTGQLKGTGSGGAVWDWLFSVDDMPSEAVLSVYKNCTRGGIYFRSTDEDDNYLFFWDADSAGFLKEVSGATTTLVDVPKVFTGAGEVTLSYREIKFSPTADEKWLFMAAWVDGELVVATADDISSGDPDKKIGFATYDSDVVYFDDIRIPELTEIIDRCALDIGSSPGSALSRVLGKRHIKHFLRYDATLRMWRPKTATSTYTYQRHFTSFDWRIDNRDVVSHWRQVGAWEEAERFDTTLIQQGITKFHRDDNPDLMTREMCYDEGGYAIQRLKEIANRADITVPGQVLGEPEDVVTLLFARDGTTIINSVDYIVDLERPYRISFRGNKLTNKLYLRKKV